ncbi:4-hydroxyphenylacetate 3-monooxygenase, oxygenase component [Heyndrickxia sp. NPDC080065]|uniref:4-hydroxyphenylacetate 3-monooxygenase, oxygenase component n=1 Tax=Heyndrickxia sp. NPDC080065 TaxID=3390568 RepID=UPI003D0242A3
MNKLINTGIEYINRIDSLNNEVWIDGKKLTGKISEHPAFSGVLKSKAALYELQNSKSEIFTFLSPITNTRVGFSFHQPTTKEDLEKRCFATQEWAKTNLGLLGRSPDYVNTCIMALGVGEKVFNGENDNYGTHIRKIYEMAMENDLSFTHTLINPQVNRSIGYFEDSEKIIAAKIIRETSDGIIIKGARLLATQGGITDEVLVLPAGGNFIEDSYIFGFSIPSNSPGLRFICRESFVNNLSTFDSPLASKFEEMDSIIVFDDVLVPWERVFLYKNIDIASKFYAETNFNTMLLYQAVARMIVKTEFILGVAESIVEAINIHEYQHVKDKMSEIISALEIMKSLHLSSRINSKLDRWNTMVPDLKPLNVAIYYYPRIYPRLVEIIQLIGGSGLIMLPTEKQFDSSIQTDLDDYLQCANATAEDRVKTFRLAWDLCMSSFGTRQTHFERYFFGDPVRIGMGLYNGYPKDQYLNIVKNFLS